MSQSMLRPAQEWAEKVGGWWTKPTNVVRMSVGLSIFWNSAKKDLINHRTALTNQPARVSRPTQGSASGTPLPLNRCPPGWMGTDCYDLTRQLPLLQNPQGGQQDLRLLQPADRREERPPGHFTFALLDEGAAGESAA